MRHVLSPGGQSNPANIIQNVPEVLWVQRYYLGLFVKDLAKLGHLPSRQGSNVADRLG